MPITLHTPDREPDDRVATMRAMLRELIMARFGVLPDQLDERIAQADSATLDTFLDRTIRVERVEEIWPA